MRERGGENGRQRQADTRWWRAEFPSSTVNALCALRLDTLHANPSLTLDQLTNRRHLLVASAPPPSAFVAPQAHLLYGIGVS